MKQLNIELTDEQCDKLEELAEKENITFYEDEQAEGFISGKMDLFLAAPDMHEALKGLLDVGKVTIQDVTIRNLFPNVFKELDKAIKKDWCIWDDSLQCDKEETGRTDG